MIALEPPGNAARDLSLFRRALFARLGEGSALAFPDLVPLAFASGEGRIAGRNFASRALEACWEGAQGAFSSEGLVICDGLLYLAMRGSLESLTERSAAAFASTHGEPPLKPGLGFFLCRPEDPERALSEALRIGPPRIGFLDCALALIALRFGPRKRPDPFSALAWRELARSKRRTGRA